MLRKLLTLIAICAGLTAVSEPARAAITTVEAVRLVERSSAPCASSAAADPSLTVRLGQGAMDKGKPCPKPTVVVVVPAVMLHADRARE